MSTSIIVGVETPLIADASPSVRAVGERELASVSRNTSVGTSGQFSRSSQSTAIFSSSSSEKASSSARTRRDHDNDDDDDDDFGDSSTDGKSRSGDDLHLFISRATICAMYIIFGLLWVLPSLPARSMFMDDMGVQPGTMSILLSWMHLPWIIKPVYGIISDRYPLFGGLKRSPYILIGLMFNAVCCSLLACIDLELMGVSWVAILLFLSTVGLGLFETALDAFIIVLCKLESDSDSGKLQSDIWIAQAAGSLLASIAMGVSLTYGGFSAQTLLAAPAIVSAVGILICLVGIFPNERRLNASKTMYSLLIDDDDVLDDDEDSPKVNVRASGERRDSANSLATLREFLRETSETLKSYPSLWKLALFTAIYASSPTTADAMFYFMQTRLGFSKNLMGSLDAAQYLAKTFGSIFYRKLLRHMPQKQLLYPAIFMSGMTTLFLNVLVLRWNVDIYIPDAVWAFGVNFLVAVCAQVTFMPIVVRVSKITPDGSEGAVYACILGIYNTFEMAGGFASGLIADALGVRADDFSSLWLLIIVSAIAHLLPIPFVPLLFASDAERSSSDDEEEVFIGIDGDHIDAPATSRKVTE